MVNNCKNCGKEIPELSEKNKFRKFCCYKCAGIFYSNYYKKRKFEKNKMKPIIVYNKDNKDYFICFKCKKENEIKDNKIVECECGIKYRIENMYYIREFIEYEKTN